MSMIDKLFGLTPKRERLNRSESRDLEDVAIFVGLEADEEHYAIVPDAPAEPRGISLEHVATLHEHRVGELARSVAEPVTEPLGKCPTCGAFTLKAGARPEPVKVAKPPASNIPFTPGYQAPRCVVCNRIGSQRLVEGKCYCKTHRPEVKA